MASADAGRRLNAIFAPMQPHIEAQIWSVKELNGTSSFYRTNGTRLPNDRSYSDERSVPRTSEISQSGSIFRGLLCLFFAASSGRSETEVATKADFVTSSRKLLFKSQYLRASQRCRCNFIVDFSARQGQNLWLEMNSENFLPKWFGRKKFKFRKLHLPTEFVKFDALILLPHYINGLSSCFSGRPKM